MDTELAAARASGKALVTISGPTGIGRTAFLGELGAQLAAAGVQVSAIRFTRAGIAVPASVGAEDDPPGPVAGGPRSPGTAGLDSAWVAVGHAAGAADDPRIGRRAAMAAAAAILRGGGESALLVDDIQWADRDSLAVLESLTRLLTNASAMFCCAIRTPAAGPAAEEGRMRLSRLRQAGLVHSVRLRPWTAAEISRRVVKLTEAAPDRELLDRLLQSARGIPLAVDESFERLRRDGSIQTISGRACLVSGQESRPAFASRFEAAVRGLGRPAWTVAKAVALVAPLGEAVPELVSEALGLTRSDTLAALDLLSREGVLHRGQEWRFPLPHWESVLAGQLGPFERRQLAAYAVRAVWAGSARCSDPDLFADLVADAGRLIDVRRAFAVLLDRAADADLSRAERVLRWLAAALDLAESRASRAAVLYQHTVACHRADRPEQSLRGAELLLTDLADSLAPDEIQEIRLIRLCSWRSLGKLESVDAIARQSGLPPAGAESRRVAQAFACSLLDRWERVRDLLAGDRWHNGADDAVSMMTVGRLKTLAAAWTGDLVALESGVAARSERPLWHVERHRVHQVGSYVTALLIIGDLGGAERLLADEHLPASNLSPATGAMLAALRGQAGQALELATRGIARGASRTDGAASAGMHLLVVSLLVAQGKLAEARDQLAVARAASPQLAYLLDIADARIDQALGENEGAVARLEQSLADAGENGLVAGTDVAWAELAQLALESDDRWLARRSCAELEKVVERMPAGRASVLAGLVRATVHHDRAAAAECLAAARERGQPFELAVVLERLARNGAGHSRLLTEAYAQYGELDALLCRAWLRNVMRDHGVAVPGRQETLVENERVLAMLAAEGLSNKQLATVLRTSEKSVEGRLSRLFLRTGYRSRIELSGAMLTGRF
ncbi:AAA family ATPase [Amycolatopsis sp. NPDC059090]|uniref:AAA family ATPase n=1 Tax=unclassified Amycolatopsis TaxID=2618356 RepID=UPI00366D9890